MKRYMGGDIAEKGKYYSPITGKLVEMESMGVLPGKPDERFYRVAGGLMMILAPAATILFVLLLPVAYVAAFTTLWGYKLINLLLGLGHARPKGAR